jgi:hypothetical protein
MNAFARLLVSGLLATLAGGCGHALSSTSSTSGHYHHHHRDNDVAGAVFAGIVVGAAVAELAQSEPERAPEPVVVYPQTVYVYGAPPAPLPRSARDTAPEVDALPAFDPQVARTALNAVDVSPCARSGAPRGYGHAKVILNPDGRISKVTIDEPESMSADAIKCVGDRLGAATVPPFRGSLVTMGTTFNVR